MGAYPPAGGTPLTRVRDAARARSTHHAETRAKATDEPPFFDATAERVAEAKETVHPIRASYEHKHAAGSYNRLTGRYVAHRDTPEDEEAF